jgi:hypothetical protein
MQIFGDAAATTSIFNQLLISLVDVSIGGLCLMVVDRIRSREAVDIYRIVGTDGGRLLLLYDD